jgi:hypothetical protein
VVESEDEEQDIKLGIPNLDKILLLGLIAEAAKGQSH